MNAPDGLPPGGHRGDHPAGRALRQVAVIGDGTGSGTPDEIDSWGSGDAHNFPLGALTRRGAVVIDLLGMPDLLGSPVHPWRGGAPDSPTPVLAVQEPATALLALPALLAAAQHAGRQPDLTGHLTCAHTLVACTPPARILPALSDPGLTDPHGRHLGEWLLPLGRRDSLAGAALGGPRSPCEAFLPEMADTHGRSQTSTTRPSAW